ncbi:MAG: hypothetical protein EOO90_12875 [Pedobacter sp.]|nr:MAG: hypothetical protein EOO90_12875 [Pedobacter sp.]
MKHTILFLALFFSIIKVEAKKLEFPIEVIAGSADLIVIGEIDAVKDNSYTFKIFETLKGQSYESIAVNMFKEWTCDIRFDKPKKGQKLFLFLKKKLSNWEIINGSSGELPILNNSITLKNEQYEYVRDKFTPYTISLVDFKIGIKSFCNCYKFVGSYASIEKWYFSQICEDDKINKFKLINNFSAWLNKKMMRYQLA